LVRRLWREEPWCEKVASQLQGLGIMQSNPSRLIIPSIRRKIRICREGRKGANPIHERGKAAGGGVVSVDRATRQQAPPKL